MAEGHMGNSCKMLVLCFSMVFFEAAKIPASLSCSSLSEEWLANRFDPAVVGNQSWQTRVVPAFTVLLNVSTGQYYFPLSPAKYGVPALTVTEDRRRTRDGRRVLKGSRRL